MIANIPTSLPSLFQSPKALPVEIVIRIESVEGIPVMRATDSIQERIETLLTKQQTAKLTRREIAELERFEQMDDYLSFVNRLIRNQILASLPVLSQ